MAWIIPSWVPGWGLSVGVLSFFVGLVYPSFQSFRAIETTHTGDDTQWLTYWVCGTTLLVLERLAWPLLCWVPFYSLARLLFLAWLVHPATKGATFLYEEFIRPLLYATADAVKDVPILQPLVSDFTPAAGRVHAKSAAPSGRSEAVSPNLDDLKAQTLAHVNETFEKAKQGLGGEGEAPEGASYFQPLKAHAT